MSSLRKEDVLSKMDDLIEMMSKKEQQGFACQLRKIYRNYW